MSKGSNPVISARVSVDSPRAKPRASVSARASAQVVRRQIAVGSERERTCHDDFGTSVVRRSKRVSKSKPKNPTKDEISSDREFSIEVRRRDNRGFGQLSDPLILLRIGEGSLSSRRNFAEQNRIK